MLIKNIVKDSMVYGSADFATKAIALLAFPIIAAALTPEAFGLLELIFSVTALLSVVVNCGLNNAVQRNYWDEGTCPNTRKVIVSSGFAAQFVFGVLAFIAGASLIPVVIPFFGLDRWPLTWVALVSALVVMSLSQWCQFACDVTRLHFLPWRFFILTLTSRVMVMCFAVVAVVFLGLGIDGLLTAQALALTLVIPLALWFIRKDFQPNCIKYSQVKGLVRYGYPFIFAGVAYWLFGAIDRWMLASMATVEEVGIYSVAFRLSSVVLFVSVAFGQAWSPIAIKIRTDHPDKYRVFYGQVLLVLLFAMLTVGGGCALFSGEMISLLMPAEYHASALPFAIICFGIILQSTQQVTAIGISIERKTYIFARLAWLTAAVNLLANWILIPSFGSVGAAWATLIAYAVLTGSYLYYTQQLHPIVFPKNQMLSLGLLGGLILLVSVTMVSQQLDWQVVSWKMLLAVSCLIVGWKLLPLYSIKSVP